MRPKAVTALSCLALLGLLALPAFVGCHQVLPDYAPELAARQGEIESLEAERRAMANQVAELKAQLADAPPEAAPEIQATIDAMQTLRAQLEAEQEAKEDALRDWKVEAAGRAGGTGLSILELILGGLLGGTTVGGIGMTMLQKVKGGPSRAQGEVDELWEKLSEQKAELARLLALFEAGTKLPPGPAPPAA